MPSVFERTGIFSPLVHPVQVRANCVEILPSLHRLSAANGGNDFQLWFTTLIARWKGSMEYDRLVSMACATIWRIWKCRNDVCFSGKRWSHEAAVSIAVKDATDFLEAQQRDRHSTGIRGDLAAVGQQQWIPPVEGMIKLNFDAGIDGANRVGGLGLVLRDSNLRFIAARSIPLQGIVDPLIAEAMAAREGLLFANSLAVKNVQLEGDSLRLIKMIKQEDYVHHSVEVVINDIRRLACDFDRCEFGFVRRSANSVAHCLASKGFGGLGVSTGEAFPPVWLFNHLSKDGYAS